MRRCEQQSGAAYFSTYFSDVIKASSSQSQSRLLGLSPATPRRGSAGSHACPCPSLISQTASPFLTPPDDTCVFPLHLKSLELVAQCFDVAHHARQLPVSRYAAALTAKLL